MLYLVSPNSLNLKEKNLKDRNTISKANVNTMHTLQMNYCFCEKKVSKNFRGLIFLSDGGRMFEMP